MEWRIHFSIEIKRLILFGKNKQDRAIFGVFAGRTHEIIEFSECKIQTKTSTEIARTILNFMNENQISVYDEKTGKRSF